MADEQDTQNRDYQYHIKEGRTYHISPFTHTYMIRFHRVEKSTYPLPNDEAEHKRLDNLQLACRELLGGNVFAPILSTAPNILDVGTGSGAWCVEVAKQFPTANVSGLDLSPIHRKDAPQNCHFILGDLNEGLKFETGSMDLVHSRLEILQ
jgi:SAM-dependent methyltransferase